MAKINYDEEADVLHVSFDQSEHVACVELAAIILLRLDTGKATGDLPRTIDLTFVSFSHLSLAKICGKSRERLKDKGELKDMASWEII